jgi:hypothetical protein
MTERFKLQGDTEQQRLAHAEIILSRLLRRPNPGLKVAMPPTVVLYYAGSVEDSGLIGRWVSPIFGTMKTLHLFVGQMAEKLKPIVTVTVRNGNAKSSLENSYKVGANLFDINLPILAGGRVEVTTSDPDAVAEISLGLLIETRLEDASKETILLEAIDAGATEG